ncbi:hypothetical protein [Bradyrhizobium sp. 6(2017)]|uniref:hypothetical protein n=1 Tax=Bradyrhizobium sp. 6(2017) TaxID=1197460 RepID=UPI0013E1F6A3|nr:hypothetical protein [Bradyrhizobium sp. 6(2017)]QIG92441.1 hypothetical protein G6P99_07930 [Bradyrhizobium sp. 6(2017)]
MENYNPALAVYLRDSTLPYWQNNVCVESIFDTFSYGPERAQAWLRYRKVSEDCDGFQRATLMHGHFEGGVLCDHTYSWTFTPGRRGDLAIVVPVANDFVAMSRHDHNVWGCVTGRGQYAGSLVGPRLRIHRTFAGWLANNCDGIVPLSNLFLPQLRNAPTLVVEDDDHAWDIAERTFINPAIKFGCDPDQAEDQAYKQIEVVA